MFSLLLGFQGFTALPAWAFPTERDLISVKISRLIVDPGSGQPVVILSDEKEKLGLPIWIGFFEANAMNAELEGVTHPRPLTHDLLETIIRKTRVKIHRVMITHLQESTYHATLMLEIDGNLVPIDARPSDSMVMALKFNAPVFVSKRLFTETAISLEESKNIEETYGITAQDLTPALAEAFSFSSEHGVLISHVEEKSLAAEAGLKKGDILFEMDGRPIKDMESMRDRLKAGKKPVEVRIHRQGQPLVLFIPANK
jgi:hypothetical protein